MSLRLVPSLLYMAAITAPPYHSLFLFIRKCRNSPNCKVQIAKGQRIR